MNPHLLYFCLYNCRGTLYEVRFVIEQIVDGSAVVISAHQNVAPDFTAIATTISESTEIRTATGFKYFLHHCNVLNSCSNSGILVRYSNYEGILISSVCEHTNAWKGKLS